MIRDARRLMVSGVRRALRPLGVDIVRARHVPTETLLGVRNLPIRTVVDCGANVGQFARRARTLFPSAAIHCFEPLPGPFAQLGRWARAHDVVHCYNVALGDQDGEVLIHEHLAHSSSSSVLATTEELRGQFPQTSSQRTVECPLTTLDSVLATDRLEQQIFLKLDVQGYESQVLAGAPALLSQTSACMIEVLVEPLYESQSEFSQLVTQLAEHGLTYAGNTEQHFGPDGRVLWLDAIFVRRT